MVFSSEPTGSGKWLDLFGIGALCYRILVTIGSTLAIVFASEHRSELALANSLIGEMPPVNWIWRLRLWQYILRLGVHWKRAGRSSEIKIFDQGFAQAVASLAMFSGTKDENVISATLMRLPRSDVAVRLVLPLEVVAERLDRRLLNERLGERLLEATREMSLRSADMFNCINATYEGEGTETVVVRPLDSASFDAGVSQVADLVFAMSSSGSGASRNTEHRLPAARATIPQACKAGDEDSAEGAAAPVMSASSAPKTAEEENTGAETQRGEPQSHTSRLARASVFALATYIAGAGLTSLAQILLARFLSPTSYGIYSYAMAWSSTVAYMATLGFSVTLLRLVPSYRARGLHGLARGLITFSMLRSTAAAVLAGLLGAAFMLVEYPHAPAELRYSLLLAMASVPLVTILTNGASLLRAFGSVVLALLPERILRDSLLMILVVIAAIWWPSSLDAGMVMKLVIVSTFAAVVMVLVTARILWPDDLRVKPQIDKSEWWGSVPAVLIITSLDILVGRTGVLVLGWAGQVEEAGVFSLAMNVALLVALPRAAVSTMFAPSAADLFARGQGKELQALYSRASLLCFAAALVIAVPLVALTEPLFGWFGQSYSDGSMIARILIVGQLATAFFGPQQNLLTMTGNQWAAANSMVIGAIANIAGCWLGNHLGGVQGAAIGIVLAVMLWNVTTMLFVRSRLQIMPRFLATMRGM